MKKIILALTVMVFVSCSNNGEPDVPTPNFIDSLVDAHCPTADSLRVEVRKHSGQSSQVVYTNSVICNQD